MCRAIQEINRISDAHCYVPVVTEASGLILVGTGLAVLAFSSILKVHECYTGQETAIPYITGHATQFYAGVGRDSLMDGFKKIAPTVGVVLAVCVLVKKYLI